MTREIPLEYRKSFLAFAEQDLLDRWDWYRDRFLSGPAGPVQRRR